MRTENYLKHGVISIVLVFALVFSMVTISAPLASAGSVIYNPGGSTLENVQGGTVTITHTLEFSDGTDGVTFDGAYTITISWLNYDNLPSENLTFVSATAYFTTGAHTGEYQQADVVNFGPSGAGDNTRWTLAVGRPTDNKDSRNGQFNVDIVLGLWGAGSTVPHIPTDNHPIEYNFAGITWTEATPGSAARDAITIVVIGAGVTVDIVPGSKSDWTGENISYAVTVTNTGALADNYDLSTTSSWVSGIFPDYLEIDNGDSGAATLWVIVGSGSDTITVTADGVYADNSDNCTATQTTGPNVKVEVEPDYLEGLPGETICYTVIITNIGTVSDNYTVAITDDAGWDLSGSPGFPLTPTVDLFISEYIEGSSYNKAIEIYNGTGASVDLSNYQLERYTNGSTTISSSAVLSGTLVNGDVYVIAHASADAAILTVADLTHAVINHNGDDGYVLRKISDNSVVDSIGQYGVDPGSSWPGGGANQTQVRKCTILQGDDNFDDAYTFATEWDAYASDTFDYIGAHQTCVSDTTTIVSLDPDENYEFTMCATIPGDAIPCTVDNITVTATSEVDNQKSDSETVQGHAEAAVEVDVLPIDPQWQEQHANKSLNYFVTIVNEGAATDTFDVVLTDTEGWNPTWDITTQILPTDDTHIAEAYPNNVADGGMDYNMYLGWEADPYYYGTTGWKTRAYLKFDISEIPHGSWIKSATLWVNAQHGPSTDYPDYTGDNMLVDAKAVEGDSWVESELTWNNAPAVGAILDTTLVIDDSIVGEKVFYSWDVTDFVAEEMLVNQLASIALMSENTEADNTDLLGQFYTKDQYPSGYWRRPYLEITYMPGVSDTTEVTLDNGESVTLGFGVTIPADVIPSTTDIITVEATSQTDNTVSDSEDAEAHAGLMRGVEAVIEGEVWQETYKDPLTYVIRIHNTGQIADMYKLTAYDKRGWPLHVEPQEIWLKPSHSAQAALSVTIPYQELGSTVDNIWVVIQGKLASGTFSDPENVQVRVDVQAHSKEVYGVDLNVYPSIHQTGHPDSDLTWLVTVTNTGNVPDTYTLGFSQYVYDVVGVYPDWTGDGLSETSIALEAYEEASILLTLTVPDTENMRTGVHDNINIWVASQTRELMDEQDVVAQVRQEEPHVPQGEIKLQAVAGYVAIDIWPTYYDFGVLNEMEQRGTPADYFTVRNIGNVFVDVTIVGMDATSKPGEPAAKWTLSGTDAIGVDMYALWWTSGGQIVDPVSKDEQILIGFLEPGDETQFDLKIQAPSTFTTPAKMWTKVAITARKLHPQERP